ncbi:MAG: transcription antiterminator BglG, partial [Thermus sp.]
LRLKEILDYLRLYRDEAKLQEEALGPYASLVRGLKEALDLLAEETLDAPELEDLEALAARLEALGFYPEEPHPLRFLFHRSPKAFSELYAEWRGEKRAKPLRHPQIRVDVLQGKALLERVLPQVRREVLVEGAWVYGQVRLKSGLFQGFRWKPRLDAEGNPIPEEVALEFPEGRVVLCLYHRAWGVRFLDERGEACPEWRPPAPSRSAPWWARERPCVTSSRAGVGRWNA